MTVVEVWLWGTLVGAASDEYSGGNAIRTEPDECQTTLLGRDPVLVVITTQVGPGR
jgi:hypothetical protein